MARITRALLQKRSEHNENIVRTLREVSLHQQKLESIDACLQRDCRELRILLLHDNQIRKLGESERETFFCGCARLTDRLRTVFTTTCIRRKLEQVEILEIFERLSE